jgi:hypothetical protein
MTKNLKPSSTNSRSRAASLRRQAKVGGYLAASVGASVLGTAPSEAAIVDIDLGPSGFNILGLGGGVAPGGFTQIGNFPETGGMTLSIFNGYATAWGLSPGSNIANRGSGYVYGTVTNFAQNALIDSSAFIGELPLFSFRSTASAPDFGPGSYMGFRFPNGSGESYGWLEVTWTAATKEFEILSGAYESVPGVGIPAGAVAVPEPTTMTLTGIAALALGAGAIRRSRKARSAAEDGSAATAI